MTQVRIPPVLRASAEGNKQVDLEGATVGDVLERLVERFPGLREQLFGAEGELNRFVNVYLNSEDVRYLSDLETPAAERDTIVVLPAMAGGATGGSASVRRGATGRRAEAISSDTLAGSDMRDPTHLQRAPSPVGSVCERGPAAARLRLALDPARNAA